MQSWIRSPAASNVYHHVNWQFTSGHLIWELLN